MSVHDRSRATLRLWLLLSAAFFVIAAVSGLIVTHFSSGRTLIDARRDTLAIARNLGYRVANLPPSEARATMSVALSEMPVLRKAEFLPVVDGKLKATVADPALARQAIHSGTPTISSTIEHAGEDHALFAYAPIRRGSRTVALVAVAVSADEVLADIRSTRAASLLGVGLAALLGCVFAGAFARHLLRTSSKSRLLRLLRHRHLLRNAFLEIAMAAVAGIVLIGGLVGVFAFQSLRAEEGALRERTQRLETLYRDVARQTALGRSTQAEVEEAQALGVEGQNVVNLLLATDIAFAEARFRQEQLHERQAAYLRSVAIAMSLSAVLTIVALVLLRATAAREHDLEEAEHVAARSEAARQQVAENLPIGFYTFGPEQIQYCNDAWRHLVEQEDDEEPTEALSRALHEDEREAVMAALRDAVATGSGFGFGHRIVTRSGEIRHVESRGVPILDEGGHLQHVVGFTIDVTSRVRTRELLEGKTREVEATNSRLRQALGDLEDNFEAMVHTLVKAVEAKDPYTAGHSERVMGYSIRIGRALGLSPHELRVLRMGALIHDVGKIGIPDAILTKPSGLTPEEFAIIKTHPEVGTRMVEGIPMFKECVPIVLSHHERLDGSGYPHGKKGAELPLSVRIVAVADCFDAMTSTRAYRKGMDPAVALEALWKSVAEGALDEKIVAQLADTVRRDGLIAHEAYRPAA
jgi:PAS domain S-box-containing protein